MLRDMAEAARAGASKDEQLKHAMQRSWMRSDPVMAESHNFSEDEESDDSRYEILVFSFVVICMQTQSKGLMQPKATHLIWKTWSESNLL